MNGLNLETGVVTCVSMDFLTFVDAGDCLILRAIMQALPLNDGEASSDSHPFLRRGHGSNGGGGGRGSIYLEKAEDVRRASQPLNILVW